MHKYLMVSEKHYLDRDNMKLLTLSKLKSPYVVEKAFYLENVSNSILYLNNITFKYINDLEFEFIFYNRKDKKRHTFHVLSEYLLFINSANIFDDIAHIYLDSDNFCDIIYEKHIASKMLCKISGLVNKACGNGILSAYLNKGLLGYKLELTYPYFMSPLKKKYYVFVYNIFGIVLDDDLMFNSFVLFGATKSNSLHIDKVIYTIDPYILKLVMLNS